jgi:hypothetical protein
MTSFMISVAPPYLGWTRLSRQSTIVSESSGLVLLAGQGQAPSGQREPRRPGGAIWAAITRQGIV